MKQRANNIFYFKLCKNLNFAATYKYIVKKVYGGDCISVGLQVMQR